MTECSFGGGFAGGVPTAQDLRLLVADALLVAADGMWVEAAGQMAAVTGLPVNEGTLRGTVELAATRSGLSDASREALAGMVAEYVRWGLMETEVFVEALSNPFTDDTPHGFENWDQALACLGAIGLGDFESAVSWAVWVCDVPARLSTEVLCAAVGETAALCGIATTGTVIDLAVHLADVAARDAAILQAWRNTLTTVTRSQDTQPRLDPGFSTSTAGTLVQEADAPGAPHAGTDRLGPIRRPSPNDREILGAIAEGHLTAGDLAKALGISVQHVRVALRMLAERAGMPNMKSDKILNTLIAQQPDKLGIWRHVVIEGLPSSELSAEMYRSRSRSAGTPRPTDQEIFRAIRDGHHTLEAMAKALKLSERSVRRQLCQVGVRSGIKQRNAQVVLTALVADQRSRKSVWETADVDTLPDTQDGARKTAKRARPTREPQPDA
ncbi:winged helix-turn-helix domain-containing protein [Streptomyces sp. NPDC051014]|uniref:winged helix-turn-helix domain-containing protein n=1 Tax=Streptomyces sp. NPDC051014 TaxID=3155751 RepID=UPI0033FB9AF3